MEKRCIFHIPNSLDENRASASQIRPKKMKEAFEHIGYKVDVVWGDADQRKNAIKRIKRNIKKGIKYDFMYSESSTMPTILTEKHHLPIHPFMDFSFFKFVKKNDIKIGLFYRDIYWKFPIYKQEVKGIKYYGAVFAYRYDLFMYNRLLNKLYLPTEYGKNYLISEVKDKLFDCLPPACENYNLEKYNLEKNKKVHLLYIGGIGEQYKIHKLLEAVREFENILLTVCCRKNEWDSVSKEYEFLMKENIKVVHKKGIELEELYSKADICLNFFEVDDYRKIAMPYKTFEYLGHGKPIISSKETAVGEFIEKNGIGWSINYERKSLCDLLKYIQKNPDELEKKKMICRQKIKENTWKERAKKVVLDLM